MRSTGSPRSAGERRGTRRSRLADRLSALEAFGGGAASEAGKASALFRGLSVLSKGIGVTAVVGDALTVIDPPDEGALGNVDRAAAGVNGTLIAATLAGAEIPVAGQVLLVGTGMYLAGNYLYHHWDGFKNVCDTVGHTTVEAGKWVGHTAERAWDGAGQAAETTTHAVTHVADDAWDGIKSIF